MDAEIDKLYATVDRFSIAMKHKLLEKHHAGYRGWDDPTEKIYICDKLSQSTKDLVNGDQSKAVNVANLAMFLHFMMQK